MLPAFNEPKTTKPSVKISKTKQPKKNFSVCQEKANLKAKSNEKSF